MAVDQLSGDYWGQFQPVAPNAQDPMGTPTNTGNTGVSGYGPGGTQMPSPQPTTGGMSYPQVIVNGPNGWWKSSPDPNAPWHGPNGETLPAGQNPPGYQSPKLPGSTGPQAAPTGGQVTMQQFNDAWLNSPYPGTVDGLKAFYAAHPEYAAAGITLGGSKGDKVYGPGGAYWGDAVISAGLGGRGKSGLSGDTGSTLGQLGYSFGASMAPFTGQFAAPTTEEAMNSPGVQFALQQQNRIMQNNAAARGISGNYRAQEAIVNSLGQTALGQYGDIYNRALNTFGTNYGIFKENQDRPFDKNITLAKLGQPQ